MQQFQSYKLSTLSTRKNLANHKFMVIYPGGLLLYSVSKRRKFHDIMINEKYSSKFIRGEGVL